MSYDIHSLEGYSTIASVSGTNPNLTIVVQTGDGSKFGNPQNVTIWPANTQPTLANSTIGRISGIASNTLTVTTAQEGSSNITVTAGMQIANTITPKALTDIEQQLYNPYKFSVYRNAAWTPGNTVFAKVQFDTELYDTNSNFDNVTNYRYTAPKAGFYHFASRAGSSIGTASLSILSLYKNGSEILRGPSAVSSVAAQVIGCGVVGDLQLSASDYVEVWCDAAGGAGDTGAPYTYFSGFLVSQT
jgi:hypothetical protein